MKPVAVIAEARIEQGLQHLQQSSPDQPIRARRDAEPALAPIGLGDHDFVTLQGAVAQVFDGAVPVAVASLTVLRAATSEAMSG